MSALTVTDAGGVRTITLDRPARLNAIDLDMIDRFEVALTSAQGDEAVRCILLRGAGRAFCAGDDMDAQEEICRSGELALRRQLASLQHISELLTLGRQPVICAIQGWAVGAGFSWVVNCDFRLWSANAVGFFPEIGYGTFVTGGVTSLLPQAVGPALAADLLLRGTRLGADAALQNGLAHAVHDESTLDAAAAALATQLAALPILAVQSAKAALRSVIAPAFRAALASEAETCISVMMDPATMSRMRAGVAGA